MSLRQRLRILILEDSETDAVLTLLALRRQGLDVEYERVDSSDAFRRALADRSWHAILSDYNMPSFNAAIALEILHESDLDLPFIVVSGAIGEELAVALMRAGAHDYVMKSNLSRLAPAVEREVREARIRQARREAEIYVQNQQRWLEQALDLTPTPIVLIELASARILFANKAADRLAGGDFIAKVSDNSGPLYFADRGGARIPEGSTPVARAVHGELLRDVEAELRGPLGSISLSIRSERMPAVFGHPETIVLSLTDVSSLKASIRVRDEFLSVASHELKTPLTALKLQMAIVSRRARQATSSDGQFLEALVRTFSSAESQVNRLSRLIDTLLDISRIARNRIDLEFEHFDLGELVGEVVTRFVPVARESGVSIESSLEKGLNGSWDRYRLEQLLSNLLSNAVKYGEGGPIYVELRKNGGLAVLRVVDHGVGIAAEDQERIFRKFERARVSAGVSGLGLGLYIASEIARAHGGGISVQSAIGQGSVFTVSLPLREAKSAA